MSITEGRRSRLRRIAMNSLWSDNGLCDISKSWRLSLLLLHGWAWTDRRRTSTLKWSNELGVGNGA